MSQLRKMLLIRSHCKMCPLPTIRSRVFVLFATAKHARSYCRFFLYPWPSCFGGTSVGKSRHYYGSESRSRLLFFSISVGLDEEKNVYPLFYLKVLINIVWRETSLVARHKPVTTYTLFFYLTSLLKLQG